MSKTSLLKSFLERGAKKTVEAVVKEVEERESKARRLRKKRS